MSDIAHDLVQVARLAITGRQQDILMYIRRLARRYSKATPDVGRQLIKLLQESPSMATPVRDAGIVSVPVDQDSNLHLVRFEYPIELDVTPIWTESIDSLLCQFCEEKQRENELLEMGVKPSRSMLFHGQPGVGKTLAAKWLAKKLDRPLLTLDLSAVMSSFLGRTGINIRNVLDYAKGIKCVLLLDELDAIAKRRDDLGEVGELKRLVTVMIQEIDDWPESGILLAATNHPDLLDPAIWRRFDVVIEYPIPSQKQTIQAIKEFLGCDSNFTLKELKCYAQLFEGLSFSEIEREILQSRRQAIIRGKDIKESLHSIIKNRIQSISQGKRKEIALNLVNAGYSQHKANSLTGVSRDTIRRAMKTV